MLPDRVSNPGPLTYESGALPIALRRPATSWENNYLNDICENIPQSFIFMKICHCKSVQE